MNFRSNKDILTRDFYSTSKNPSLFWHTSWLPSDFSMNFINFPRFTSGHKNSCQSFRNVTSSSSGLEKWQCTVQLTIFPDGVSCIIPLVIFRGTGLRIKAEEKRKRDKRVKVLFQKNVWCDEKMMKEWRANECANFFTNPLHLDPQINFGSWRSQSTANCKCEKVTSK